VQDTDILTAKVEVAGAQAKLAVARIGPLPSAATVILYVILYGDGNVTGTLPVLVNV
jgi:hypothetical protein